MVRGELPEKEPVKVKKALSELYEDFLKRQVMIETGQKNSFYKYNQTWDHLNECCPGIIRWRNLNQRERLRELKNWYVDKGYCNTTIKKMFSFSGTFIKWLQTERL